jgi:hypothetical protein
VETSDFGVAFGCFHDCRRDHVCEIRQVEPAEVVFDLGNDAATVIGVRVAGYRYYRAA